MNRVLEIQDKMRETAALIAQIEKQLTIHHSKSASASLRSLYKVSHALKAEGLKVAMREIGERLKK